MEGVLVTVTIAVIKHVTESKLGRKEFNWLTLPHHTPSLIRSGQGLKQDGNWKRELMHRP